MLKSLKCSHQVPVRLVRLCDGIHSLHRCHATGLSHQTSSSGDFCEILSFRPCCSLLFDVRKMILGPVCSGLCSGQTGKMSSNVQKKRQILIDEAVVFEGEDRISQESLHTFDTRLTSKTKLRR
mmetsp:Transcript_53041/g.108122  ORF Transcript_53041/g.108122 Transcript_53041/m.108122 type:complete len:124 (-) Transcript_53041:132-503(-)